MNITQAGSIAALGCALAMLASSHAGAEAHGQADTVAMSASDVVEARRTSYFLSTQAVGQIKAGYEDGGDLERAAFAARLLVRWAQLLPSMFPDGTDLEASNALPTVWTDREGFSAAAAAYRDAAQSVADSAASGDREATKEAFFAMAGTCHSCHRNYRK
ncbi:c-type cytochrome [Qipengyuania nanhaisediminis]|uniref:c-type cytochrome n=1 Tax=Qipengyuania nanhaisediminis TaxID=604088 RepID=UPI0038B3DD89